ncbi:MAG: N-acetylmuramoyl-L-alanine amidase family protein [Anaerorhabdus sp.]|uniref:peptidoglycan recognition protein family protein n=1 Tax=Anaerorhabdus sp. TaxID=1872524 RepID=UPI003A87DD49
MLRNREQFGIDSFEVKGITIHNTGTKDTAYELYKKIRKSSMSNGAHFLVDKDQVIQLLPLNHSSWHTGKGYDFGNLFTIAIEICQSQSDDYFEAQKRAATLIKQLLKSYGLTTADIYFHNDFNERTYCPHRILDIYKTKEEFIKEVLENA